MLATVANESGEMPEFIKRKGYKTKQWHVETLVTQPHNYRYIYMYIFYCLFGFYGVSAFVGYFMPNLFLYKSSSS